ncbi:hypothetical protein [Actinacidiphila reveromycinica]|nr:hypothetical protein [Streptomyces sp. SN-593]
MTTDEILAALAALPPDATDRARASLARDTAHHVPDPSQARQITASIAAAGHKMPLVYARLAAAFSLPPAPAEAQPDHGRDER